MLHLLLYILLAIALAGGLFLLAARFLPAGEQIAPPLRDEPPWDLPAERALNADDVDSVRLPVALRGYRFAETDILLDRLAEELRARDAEIVRLRGRVGAASPRVSPSAYRERVSPSVGVEPQRVSPSASVEPQRVSPSAGGEPQRVSPSASVEPQRVSPSASVEPQRVSPSAGVEPQRVSPSASVEPQRVDTPSDDPQRRHAPEVETVDTAADDGRP